MNLINNRNILLAPNSFKGSLDAFEFCRILASELEECGFHTISLPLGDGGDGTARIVAHYLHAHPIKTKTVDALGREHFASYYLKDNTAIIELAEAGDFCSKTGCGYVYRSLWSETFETRGI